MLLVPPNYCSGLDVVSQSKPTTVFLAGPIQGASDWQSEAYSNIIAQWQSDWESHIDKGLIVCSPRRNDDTWKFDYAQQVDWESYHLRAASEHGIIMFWLAKENQHFCDRAYAQTTRFELGEWLAKKPEKVIIGVEPGFTGERYVRHRFSKSHMIHSSLEKTCEAVVTACR